MFQILSYGLRIYGPARDALLDRFSIVHRHRVLPFATSVVNSKNETLTILIPFPRASNAPELCHLLMNTHKPHDPLFITDLIRCSLPLYS